MTTEKRKCKDCAKYFKDTYNLCVLAEMGDVNSNTDSCDNFEEYYNDEYCPSSTNYDYSPSNPWDAPGMSLRDFI